MSRKIYRKTLQDFEASWKRLHREVEQFVKLDKRLEHESFEFCRDSDLILKLNTARVQLQAGVTMLRSFLAGVPMDLIEVAGDEQCSI